MKIRSALSLLLAILLCCSTLVIGAAAAPVAGDVDGDNSVTASDARLALRASVKLETLTAAQILVADVDNAEGVSAADARLILRASVKLETLTLKQKFFNGHPVDTDTITPEHGIVCTDPDCGITLVPSFNEIVNALKADNKNSFSTFTKTTSVADKPVVKESSVLYLSVKELMEGLLADSFQAESSVEYSNFIKNRSLNKSTFFVKGKEYVSDLKDGDVKSITLEKMTGVDFVKTLPDSYTATNSSLTYDLSKIKASVIGDVYKITVTLNDEKVTDKSFPQTVTPIEKCFIADYNIGLKSNLQQLTSAFNEFPEELASMFGMDATITSGGTITYYVTVDTFKPVAAVYSLKMDTDTSMKTYFNSFGVNVNKVTSTMTISTRSTQEYFYFFNDNFTIE